MPQSLPTRFENLTLKDIKQIQTPRTLSPDIPHKTVGGNVFNKLINDINDDSCSIL